MYKEKNKISSHLSLFAKMSAEPMAGLKESGKVVGEVEQTMSLVRMCLCEEGKRIL